jgi:hypothetical protein
MIPEFNCFLAASLELLQFGLAEKPGSIAAQLIAAASAD